MNAGKFDCIQALNGKLYAAIIDNSTSWKTISYFISNDLGNTWSSLPFVQEDRDIIKNVKLVSTPNEVFSFYQTEDTLRIFNITRTFSDNYFTFPVSINTFDVEYCGFDGKIYILFDRGNLSEYLILLPFTFQNGAINYGSLMSIMEWGNNPKLSIHENKIAMCFFVGRQEPLSSREVHYRFGRINNMGSIDFSNSKEIIPNAPIKNEIDVAIIANKVYLLFVEQTGTSLDIRGVVSLNEGIDFSPVFDIASEPNKNEQWIDLSNKSEFNLSYFEEEIQSGNITNETNKIAFKFDQNTSELAQFSVTTYASSHPPYWAVHEPKPKIVPLNNQGAYDCGVLWAGQTNSGTQVYWNRFLAATNIEGEITLPAGFELSQNYPNPFNPSTTINYKLPISGYVTLKVYDVLGNEVATLVNEFQQPGNYSSHFSNLKSCLTSGIYYYTLRTGNYTETKKMILVK